MSEWPQCVSAGRRSPTQLEISRSQLSLRETTCDFFVKLLKFFEFSHFSSNMATKGGLSKQLKKKLPPPQRVPVVINLQRTETHAGLPRQIYTDLHYIPSPSRLFKTEKDDLAAQISSLTRKRDRIQAAFDAASKIVVV